MTFVLILVYFYLSIIYGMLSDGIAIIIMKKMDFGYEMILVYSYSDLVVQLTLNK